MVSFSLQSLCFSNVYLSFFFFFFFQAEDGIRDADVTGVQTCALPIWFAIAKAMLETGITPDFIVIDGAEGGTGAAPLELVDHVGMPLREALWLVHNTRSEERRVGKECRSRWAPEYYKKKRSRRTGGE